MKKISIFIIAIMVVLIGFVIFIQNVNINRLGTDEYYVQISNSVNKTEDKTDSGQVYVQYEYQLSAFDKSGNKKEFTFTASKELRKDAYLMLFVKDEKGVTSYEEVKKADIPKKALDQLGK